MSSEDPVFMRKAIDLWKERLQAMGRGHRLWSPAEASPMQWSDHVHHATDSLVDCLLECGVPIPLVSELSEVLETMKSIHTMGIPNTVIAASLNGVPVSDIPSGPSHANGDTYQPYGLAVHQTSIGRRASSSYNVYDRVGGWETLSAAVDGLYKRMCGDPRVLPDFKNRRDEERLKTQTLEVMVCAFGGQRQDSPLGCLYADMAESRTSGDGSGGESSSHPPPALGIAGMHFDIMMEHMRAVLEELSLPADVVSISLAMLRASRNLFERGGPPGDSSRAGGGATAVAAGDVGGAMVSPAEEYARGCHDTTSSLLH